jgi:uncharacterized protein YdeI (BOF family)
MERNTRKRIHFNSEYKGDQSMKKKMMLLVVAFVMVVSLLAVGTAFAQTGSVPTTIAEILVNPVRDQMVTLTGVITQIIEGNEFTLDDGSGTILVDGGPAWFHTLNLSTGQTVTITGEVDLGKPASDSTKTEIGLFSFTSDGHTTTVRESTGRPAWAGARGNGQGRGTQQPDDD